MCLPGFGSEGQRTLTASRVAVVGCGATGGAQAEWLARAGVGELVLIDRDWVEQTNLQRQLLFDEADLGEPKAVAAARQLGRVNSAIRVFPRVRDLSPDSIEGLLEGCDLVLDGTDNFASRLLLNDWALETGTAWIYSAALGYRGQSALFLPGGPCFRCFLPEIPPVGSVATCDTAGVLGPAVGVVASLSACKALRYLTGQAEEDAPGIDLFDASQSAMRRAALQPDPACPACHGERDFLLGDAYPRSSVLCGRNAVQLPGAGAIDLAELAARLAPHGDVQPSRFFLRFAVEGLTLTVFPDGRCVILGTEDPARARAVKDRYLGG